jgi:hypothetical protein
MKPKEVRLAEVRSACRDMGRGLWAWRELAQRFSGQPGFSQNTLQEMVEQYANHQGAGEWRTKDSTFD